MRFEDLPFSLSVLGHAYRSKHLSPVDVVETLLERIEELDGELNAFITVLPERALEAARQAERELVAGNYRGQLHGIPLAVKDMIYTDFARTTMASAFFKDYLPDHSAPVVSKLEESGAIILGKTNLHEFAYGATGDRSFFGPTRNPHDPTLIAGGSSSGSAAAVAAGLCYGALGTDTAGSVRIPSALCGVVGMKPTRGLVSNAGVFPLSKSLDHVGPITRTVEDSAILLWGAAGPTREATNHNATLAETLSPGIEADVGGGKIGVPAAFFFEHVEGQVRKRVEDSLATLRSLGVQVEEVDVPFVEDALRAQRAILAIESYAVHKQRLENTPDGFDEEVRNHLLSGERLKAYRYVEAQESRPRFAEEFERLFERIDVLVTPTVPLTATEIGMRQANIDGHVEHVDAAFTRLTGPTNLTGLPSMSLNCGFNSLGLPVGLQLIGARFDEVTVFRYAHALEAGV